MVMVHKIRLKIDYGTANYSEDVLSLDVILKNAKITDALKNAIIELKDALKKKDYNKAYELSAVKSFIVHTLKPSKRHNFREDAKFNEKKLGNDIYGYLDGLHHKISLNLMKRGREVIPSGAMIIGKTTEGLVIQQKGLPPKGMKSPTLERIKFERKEIEREAKKRYS